MKYNKYMLKCYLTINYWRKYDFISVTHRCFNSLIVLLLVSEGFIFHDNKKSFIFYAENKSPAQTSYLLSLRNVLTGSNHKYSEPTAKNVIQRSLTC